MLIFCDKMKQNWFTLYFLQIKKIYFVSLTCSTCGIGLNPDSVWCATDTCEQPAARHIPYFMDYKTHFFLQKIASKIQVHLILENNIEMSSVWFKIPASLKNGDIFTAVGNLSLSGNIGFNWQQQCTDSTNMSSGMHKLANTVSLLTCHHKPRTLPSLRCIIAVYGDSEIELKVIWYR